MGDRLGGESPLAGQNPWRLGLWGSAVGGNTGIESATPFSIADGTVIHELHRQHRAVELRSVDQGRRGDPELLSGIYHEISGDTNGSGR